MSENACPGAGRFRPERGLEHETFLLASWLAIYAGLHLWPQRYEPVVEILASAELDARLEGTRESIRRSVETLPTPATFLNEIVKRP